MGKPAIIREGVCFPARDAAAQEKAGAQPLRLADEQKKTGPEGPACAASTGNEANQPSTTRAEMCARASST